MLTVISLSIHVYELPSEIIRILHEFEVLIERSVRRPRQVMLNCDLRDSFVDQYLALMKDTVSCPPRPQTLKLS